MFIYHVLVPWDCFLKMKKFLLADQALSGSATPDMLHQAL